jgi:hypothetical protein
MRRFIFAAAIGSLAILGLPGPRGVHAYAEHTTHLLLTYHTVALLLDHHNLDDFKSHDDKLRKGVIDEDSGTRYLQHFYDPVTEHGLAQNSYTMLFAALKGDFTAPSPFYPNALEWGRNGTPDDQDWEGAIAAYDYTEVAKRHAYEALGHVLHLLQDMGQPDHARGRPHAGNYLKDDIEHYFGAKAANRAVDDKVGYERLWDGMDWERATSIRERPSLDSFFHEMAALSQSAEKDLGLPLKPEEAALGLAWKENIIPVSSDYALMTTVTNQYPRFGANTWRQTELRIALTPTIVPPRGNSHTNRHLQLGRKLLPLAEEYGAGLLLHFHDIVNPPPFVASVEVSQGGLKYKADWVTEDSDHPKSRKLVKKGDDALERTTQADVTITFGPIGEKVKEVVVTLEPEGGTGSERCGGEKVKGELDEAGVWAGHFSPERSASLCIEARDQDRHFEERKPKGDELDGDPATPAKAGVKPPYPWSDYKPGPDRNHALTVKASCKSDPLTPAGTTSIVWGTWKGTIRRQQTSKDFDRILPGPDDPHARLFTESHDDISAVVTARSVLDLRLAPHIPANRSVGNGTFTRKFSQELRYGDGVDPNRWTSFLWGIRCPDRWPTHRSGARAASSLTSSKPAPCAWSSTKARASGRRRAISI